MHSEDPAVEEYEPAAQRSHAVDELVAPNRPRRQLKQNSDPAAENVPDGQTAQTDDPAAEEYCPAKQAVQRVELVEPKLCKYVPATQRVQAIEPVDTE